MRGGGLALALALTVLLGVAGVGALVESGCATTQATGVRAERPADTAPDGGWVNYRPARRPYEPDPTQAAVGEPTISPFGLSGADVH